MLTVHVPIVVPTGEVLGALQGAKQRGKMPFQLPLSHENVLSPCRK